MKNFNKKGISQISNKKPVVYTIKNRSGKEIYVGTAKRNRVQDRLIEHLDEIPGAKVSTRSYNSIDDARKAEEAKIKRVQPKYNKQHTKG